MLYLTHIFLSSSDGGKTIAKYWFQENVPEVMQKVILKLKTNDLVPAKLVIKVADDYQILLSKINTGDVSIDTGLKKSLDELYGKSLNNAKKDALEQIKNVKNASNKNDYETILSNFKNDYETKKLTAGDYGGSRNYGVYDYDGKIIKITQPKRMVDMSQVKEFSKRLSDMKNVYFTKNIIKLSDGNYAMIMDKANGVGGDKLSKSQINGIPEEHWIKFEKDVRELSERGVQVDLTKRDNFIYDTSEGFKFIDMSGISVDNSGTDKFFMKDGVEYYYPFEQYRFFPKKFEGGKQMFENIPQTTTPIKND